MADEHLFDLAVIVMHYNDRMSVDEFCNSFEQTHPRRLFKASIFPD